VAGDTQATNSTVQSVSTNKTFWFPVGEKLIYKLYWGIIPVGALELSSEWVEEEGKKLLAIRAVARTTSIVAKIYPVEDFIESIIDPVSFLPLRYTQRLKEGRHLRDDKIRFDHGKRKAYWESGLDDSNGEIEIDADTRDVLCLVYFMRSKGFDVGATEKFRVLVDEKLYDLEVTGIEHEKLQVKDFGKVKCLKVQPKAKFGEIFVRKGRVNLWFSLDARHVCTRMTGKVPVASVKAILVGVKGPGDDIWSKPKKK
jgi:hypothetical protein